VRLVTQPLLGLALSAPAQAIEIFATHVREFDSFEELPDALVGVEIRRIVGQAFEMDALEGTSGQKILDSLAPMLSIIMQIEPTLSSDVNPHEVRRLSPSSSKMSPL